MTKIEEIQALVATNTKLRKERSGWEITGPSCTWVVLTERLIHNEAALRKAYKELAASVQLEGGA